MCSLRCQPVTPWTSMAVRCAASDWRGVHSRMARRVASWLPGYAYDDAAFFDSDGAPAGVAEMASAGLSVEVEDVNKNDLASRSHESDVIALAQGYGPQVPQGQGEGPSVLKPPKYVRALLDEAEEIRQPKLKVSPLELRDRIAALVEERDAVFGAVEDRRPSLAEQRELVRQRRRIVGGLEVGVGFQGLPCSDPFRSGSGAAQEEEEDVVKGVSPRGDAEAAYEE